ncbi:MAG TPA: response regulator transcription factor [Anaerolineae bacterium]|nr:response regulator transcription factor [Anaerolineae bacterium]
MPPTILIVEDHAALRASLHDWLGAAFPACELLEARSGEEAIELARTRRPDLILMDICRGAVNGIEATRRIMSERPASVVVMLTSYEADEYQTLAVEAGAVAFVSKNRIFTKLIPLVDCLLPAAPQTITHPIASRCPGDPL